MITKKKINDDVGRNWCQKIKIDTNDECWEKENFGLIIDLLIKESFFGGKIIF